MPRNASVLNLAAGLRCTYTGEPHERALIEVRHLSAADVFHVDHLSPRLLRHDASVQNCHLPEARFLQRRLIPPARSPEQEIVETAVLHRLGDLQNSDRLEGNFDFQFTSISLRSVSPRANECVIDMRDGFHAGLLSGLVAEASAGSPWEGGVPGARFARQKDDVVVALLSSRGIPAGRLRIRKVPSRHWSLFHDHIDYP